MTGSRPHSHERENDDLKPGQPPRPASEPRRSEGTSNSLKTKTDPASGLPNP